MPGQTQVLYAIWDRFSQRRNQSHDRQMVRNDVPHIRLRAIVRLADSIFSLNIDIVENNKPPLDSYPKTTYDTCVCRCFPAYAIASCVFPIAPKRSPLKGIEFLFTLRFRLKWFQTSFHFLQFRHLDQRNGQQWETREFEESWCMAKLTQLTTPCLSPSFFNAHRPMKVKWRNGSSFINSCFPHEHKCPQWQYTNIRIFVVCTLYNVGTTDNDQNDFISTMNRTCS